MIRITELKLPLSSVPVEARRASDAPSETEQDRAPVAHPSQALQELAAQARISLRTGCFCNPGAGEAAEDLTEGDMRAAIEQAGREINLQRFLHVMQARGGKTAGAIRVSTGLASNFADVERFIAPDDLLGVFVLELVR